MRSEEPEQEPAWFFKRATSLMQFPNPRGAPFGDIVAVGGNLRPENLLRAYRRGIFPWPMEGWPLTWFCPRERAVIEWDDLHVPRRLARLRRRPPFHFTFDRDFAGVVLNCALAPRPEQEGTWITREVFDGYTALHRAGHAHSIEVWEGDALVGGLYGVDAGGAFAGESMFYLRPNASKLAFLFLFERLHERGLGWLDIQVMTPHMHAFGAKLIPREIFLDKLAEALSRKLQLFPPPPNSYTSTV